MSLGAHRFKSDQADELAAYLTKYRRILLLGEMGAGKSTLAIKLLQFLTDQAGGCRLLELDPGTPPFGIPGTVSQAKWGDNGVIRQDCQALCTLDAARFRLPLILAARRLFKNIEKKSDKNTIVLIDPPGVVRGVGGAEMLLALTEFLRVDVVVALHRENAPLPLAQELGALRVAVLPLPISPAARAGSRLERLKHRSRLWDDYLSEGIEETIVLDDIHLLGTPPPRQAPNAWTGRQAALLDAMGDTVRMGEVLQLNNGELALRMVPGKRAEPVCLLIRDAGRNAMGRLETVRRADIPLSAGPGPVETMPPFVSPKDGSTPLFSNLDSAWATLVGGVFGDPLVHVRLRRLKQSLLFDLGNPARLPAKIAHQVGYIFLSHAHLDHIGGLTWFLRSRFGPFGPCKIFGPLETIHRIESFFGAITWDRIGDAGPVFEVYEIDRTSLRHTRLQPGRKRIDLPEIPVSNGIVLKEESFTIRAAICDHGIPSIAYALLFQQEMNVRKERLTAAHLSPGPWLGTLKRCISAKTPEVEIKLPNGGTAKAGELAEDLIIMRPGKKLVYAADMADTPENREKVIELAGSAHTFFCETAFTLADKDKADATQHLTTHAAVRIARAAGVKRMIPFHFSKRYERNIQQVYSEILAEAGPVQVIGHFRGSG